MTVKPLKFEEALQALEELVAKMEKGELPLEESIASFERGMQLAKLCESKLAEAEGKVEKLLEATPRAQAERAERNVEITDGEEEDIPF